MNANTSKKDVFEKGKELKHKSRRKKGKEKESS